MNQSARQRDISAPVLIPEQWGSRGKEATRRRRKRSPVAAVSNAAHIGYRILQLNQDLAALETEHERLHAIASSLRAPDRIERLAIERLGLVTPRAEQITVLSLPTIASRQAPPKPPGLWERFGGYFHRSEAAAAEPPQ
jgi:hypothetical protein